MKNIAVCDRFIGRKPGRCYSMGVSHPEAFAAGTNLVLNSAEAPLTSLTLYGWSKQDGTPSLDNPVPIVSAGSVMTTGAQLFDASKIASTSKGGATLTNNGNGSFTISGEGELTDYFLISLSIPVDQARQFLKEGYIYTNGSEIIPQFYCYTEGATTNISTANVEGKANITTQVLNEMTSFKIVFYSASGRTITPGTFWPMMWQDGNGTWEPYTGGQPAANPYEGEINVTVSDGGEQSQPLTVKTPGGLPGIPVTVSRLPEGMEPTYVDASGQAWVCDEVDFERGVYVRRVWRHVFDGSENWNEYSNYKGFFANALPEAMSSREGIANQLNVIVDSPSTHDNNARFGASNQYFYIVNVPFSDSSLPDFGLSNWKAHLAAHPLEVMTYLTTATEEPLTAEEIAAYKALHTYSPTTTVSNDAEAWMRVGYYGLTAIQKLEKEALLINGGKSK